MFALRGSGAGTVAASNAAVRATDRMDAATQSVRGDIEMSEETVRQLATQIAHEQFGAVWSYYLLALAISVVACAVAAYIGAYFQERGKNYATAADFKTLLEQQRTATAAVEEIKSSISRVDWADREWRTI